MRVGDYIQITTEIKRWGRPPIPKGTRGTVTKKLDGGAMISFTKPDDEAWVLPKEVSVIVKEKTKSG